MHDVSTYKYQCNWPNKFRDIKKGYAHAHVQSNSHIPCESFICAWCHSVYKLWAQSAQPVPRHKKTGAPCAHAIQYPCRHVRAAYMHGVIQHTKCERNWHSQSWVMEKGYARAHVLKQLQIVLMSMDGYLVETAGEVWTPSLQPLPSYNMTSTSGASRSARGTCTTRFHQ